MGSRRVVGPGPGPLTAGPGGRADGQQLQRRIVDQQRPAVDLVAAERSFATAIVGATRELRDRLALADLRLRQAVDQREQASRLYLRAEGRAIATERAAVAFIVTVLAGERGELPLDDEDIRLELAARVAELLDDEAAEAAAEAAANLE